MARADRYALRIPDRYADSVRWRRRRAGRDRRRYTRRSWSSAARPRSSTRCSTATEARGAEVARAARLSPSATSAALRVLAEHGLAERGRGGWRRGAAGLDDVATSTGAADLHRERSRAVQAGPGELAGPARAVPGPPPAAGHVTGTAGGRWMTRTSMTTMVCRWPVIFNDGVRAPPGSVENWAPGTA